MIIKSNSHNGTGKINEDYLVCREISENSTIAILADGMGGYTHGGLAAQIAVETISQAIEKQIGILSPKELLTNAIYQANDAVNSKCHTLRCKMGAAIAVLLVIDQKAYFSWLGNVRIYLKEGNGLMRLTSDHTSPEYTSTDSQNQFLTRCINGKGFREEPPFQTISLASASFILLCTDGFYQNLTLDDISKYGAEAVQFITGSTDDFSVIELFFPHTPS